MRIFRVLKQGVLSTYQDLGRFGYEDRGITNGGASDEISYRLVNRLLNNLKNSTAIEIVLGNFSLEVLESCRVAIGGAEMRAKVNGEHKRNWSAFPLKKGDILEFGYAAKGQIAYLGIEGGFNAKKILNSSSICIKDGIGQALKEGDTIEAKSSTNTLKSSLSPSIIPSIGEKSLSLRLTCSYQHKWFDKEKFFNSTFRVSNRYDKMGYQLEGEEIKPRYDTLISEAIAFGAVQVTSAGHPIVLLKERQTIGGYPKIGTVLPIDCFKLSQTGANTKIIFKEITLDEAREECLKARIQLQ